MGTQSSLTQHPGRFLREPLAIPFGTIWRGCRSFAALRPSPNGFGHLGRLVVHYRWIELRSRSHPLARMGRHRLDFVYQHHSRQGRIRGQPGRLHLVGSLPGYFEFGRHDPVLRRSLGIRPWADHPFPRGTVGPGSLGRPYRSLPGKVRRRRPDRRNSSMPYFHGGRLSDFLVIHSPRTRLAHLRRVGLRLADQ